MMARVGGVFRIGVVACMLLSMQACQGATAIGKPAPIDKGQLAAEKIGFDGTLAAAYRISDAGGEHILVLSRKAGASPAQPRSGRIERIDLVATYHTRMGTKKWQQEWSIRDLTDCPGLDAEADFFATNVSFSDLNKDGKAEVTVPYRLFCGGGVDPKIIKVILRDGATKLAIRGESLVRYPGQEPFGGEHQHDKALLAPERAPYKQHLDAIWKKVSVDMRK